MGGQNKLRGIVLLSEKLDAGVVVEWADLVLSLVLDRMWFLKTTLYAQRIRLGSWSRAEGGQGRTRSFNSSFKVSEDLGPLMNMHFLGFSTTLGSLDSFRRIAFLLTAVAVAWGGADMVAVLVKNAESQWFLWNLESFSPFRSIPRVDRLTFLIEIRNVAPEFFTLTQAGLGAPILLIWRPQYSRPECLNYLFLFEYRRRTRFR